MRPNILLIVVDNTEYNDITPFGGEIKSPALANQGIMTEIISELNETVNVYKTNYSY